MTIPAYNERRYVHEGSDEAREEGWYGYEPLGHAETEAHTLPGVIAAMEESKPKAEPKARRSRASSDD